MRAGVVIVAAGRGERLGHLLRKAMVPVRGRPMVLRAAEAFAAVADVVETVLVMHAADRDALRAEWGDALEALGTVRFTEGGARRQDSVMRGLAALGEECEAALVHDAARPFVSADLVRRMLAALDDHAAVVPVVPATSTVKRVAGGRVVETVPRSELRLAQTPQGARRLALIAALEETERRGIGVTDDAQAMELAGHTVAVVEDSPSNFKVTTPEDLEVAEILAARWERAAGEGP